MPAPVHSSERIVRRDNPAEWDAAAAAWGEFVLEQALAHYRRDFIETEASLLAAIYTESAIRAAAGIYEECSYSKGGALEAAFNAGRGRGQFQLYRIIDAGGPVEYSAKLAAWKEANR